MQLEDIYKSILDFADCKVNEAGYIQIEGKDKNINILIDGKDLVFPTNEQLRSPSPNTVIFHPLMENDLGGEPIVVTRFRELIFMKFNKIIASLMVDLISILNSPEIHKSLSQEAKDLLYQGIEVNAGSAKALTAIHNAEKMKLNKLYVNGWLRKGGSVRGRTYARGCIISFPLYNSLGDEAYLADLPKGVRKIDPDSFRRVIKYIFPNVETPGEYYEGSDSRIAPFFDALMKGAKTIASRIQDVIDMFQEHLAVSAGYSFNGDWIEAFNNLEALRGQIALIPSVATPTVQAPVVNNAISPSFNHSPVFQPPVSAPSQPGVRKSISELANSSPQFGLNVLQANNQLGVQNNMLAMQAMLSGNINASNAGMVNNLLVERQKAQERLLQQLGPAGANFAMQLMAQGMDERSAVMKAMVEMPKMNQFSGNSPMNTQTIQQFQTQANPQGELVSLNGKNYVRIQTPQGSQFIEVA